VSFPPIQGDIAYFWQICIPVVVASLVIFGFDYFRSIYRTGKRKTKHWRILRVRSVLPFGGDASAHSRKGFQGKAESGEACMNCMRPPGFRPRASCEPDIFLPRAEGPKGSSRPL
jgi:hypothetical protein